MTFKPHISKSFFYLCTFILALCLAHCKIDLVPSQAYLLDEARLKLKIYPDSQSIDQKEPLAKQVKILPSYLLYEPGTPKYSLRHKANSFFEKDELVIILESPSEIQSIYQSYLSRLKKRKYQILQIRESKDKILIVSEDPYHRLFSIILTRNLQGKTWIKLYTQVRPSLVVEH